MALFNYAAKEITLKIVYYGPGLCGKTTNLQRLHANMNPDKRTKLLSLSTESDRTLFFDFMPIALGKIKDFDIKFQLYTVPGQVRYNATRKLVLKGADAVVFVADSQTAMKEANVESLQNMKENLIANNINPDDIPIVLQYNKRDLDNILPLETLDRGLNPGGDNIIEAAAINGTGVEETFKLVTQRLLKHISKKHNVQIEVPEEAKSEEKAYTLERSGADDSVVSISVQDKGEESVSVSEIEENLLKTSMPDSQTMEEDPLSWPSSGGGVDELPTAEELYDESAEVAGLESLAGKTSDILEIEEVTGEASVQGGTQEVLMQILQELRESRKQQDKILEALNKLGSKSSGKKS